MKIVIIGDGKVERTIIEHMSREGHEIVVIDNNSFFTNFTASLTCISNVGPAFGDAFANFRCFSWFSKLVLTFEMIAGRLEIFPLLLLFYPKTWMKR